MNAMCQRDVHMLTLAMICAYQLPAAQLENALHRSPALKAPLIAHASETNIRSSLPRFFSMLFFFIPFFFLK